MAEHARREASCRRDHLDDRRRVRLQVLADRRQRQVTERASPLPEIETGRRGGFPGTRPRIEVGKGLQPVDARNTVAGLAALLRIEKVVGQDAGVSGRETEAFEPLQHLGSFHHASLRAGAVYERTVRALRI